MGSLSRPAGYGGYKLSPEAVVVAVPPTDWIHVEFHFLLQFKLNAFISQFNSVGAHNKVETIF